MKEKWRDIPGYKGYYQVSDLGRVRSLSRVVSTKDKHGVWRERRTRPRFLNPGKLVSGHLMVALCKNGKPRQFLVHALVLVSFVGPCPVGMESRHANDVPDDNRLENLSWGTRHENMIDRYRNKPEIADRAAASNRGRKRSPEFCALMSKMAFAREAKRRKARRYEV